MPPAVCFSTCPFSFSDIGCLELEKHEKINIHIMATNDLHKHMQRRPIIAASTMQPITSSITNITGTSEREKIAGRLAIDDKDADL